MSVQLGGVHPKDTAVESGSAPVFIQDGHDQFFSFPREPQRATGGRWIRRGTSEDGRGAPVTHTYLRVAGRNVPQVKRTGIGSLNAFDGRSPRRFAHQTPTATSTSRGLLASSTDPSNVAPCHQTSSSASPVRNMPIDSPRCDRQWNPKVSGFWSLPTPPIWRG